MLMEAYRRPPVWVAIPLLGVFFAFNPSVAKKLSEQNALPTRPVLTQRVRKNLRSRER